MAPPERPPPAGAPVPPQGAVVPVPEARVAPVKRRFVLVLSGVLLVCGTIGTNIAPALVDDHPELILALSSRNRNLFASVPFITPAAYVLIGFSRVLLAGVTLYFLGRWYGAKAIEWVEGQVGELPAVYRWFQRAVDRAGWLMLVVFPGSNLVCIMAGLRRMAVPRFLVFICIGIAIKLAVLWAGGRAFEDQIRWFLDAISDYQWYVVAGLFAITFLQSGRRQRGRAAAEVLHEIETPDGVVEPPRERSPHD